MCPIKKEKNKIILALLIEFCVKIPKRIRKMINCLLQCSQPVHHNPFAGANDPFKGVTYPISSYQIVRLQFITVAKL